MLAAAVILLGACLVSARPNNVAADVGFFDPTAEGGSWLDDAAPGLGEPLNVSAVPVQAHKMYQVAHFISRL
jgi:hypothetical protein